MKQVQIEKYTERLEKLIAEGKELAELEKPTKKEGIKTVQEHARLQAWRVKAENAVALIFGKTSVQYSNFLELKKKKPYYASTIKEIYGLLQGCLDDFETGFIFGLESLLLRETFSSILEDAKELKNNYTRSAAIYCRVVTENMLKKLAKKEGINLKGKSASVLNDKLKEKKVIDKADHSYIKAWLVTGNEAAHEENFKHSEAAIGNIISGLERVTSELLGGVI